MKDIIISKELLSEVLDKEVTNIKMHHINDEYIYFDYIGKQSRIVNEVSIDIYKLAHKCKEWAYFQYGIIIQSYLYNGKWRVDILKGIEIDEFFKNIDSEPESIFKACQWLLEELKK